MIAIGMDIHSSKTTAYAVPLEKSDLNDCEICDDFNRSFKNFYSDRPGYIGVASFLNEIEHCILIENSTKTHEVFWMMTNVDLTILISNATDLFRITKSYERRVSTTA